MARHACLPIGRRAYLDQLQRLHLRGRIERGWPTRLRDQDAAGHIDPAHSYWTPSGHLQLEAYSTAPSCGVMGWAIERGIWYRPMS